MYSSKFTEPEMRLIKLALDSALAEYLTENEDALIGEEGVRYQAAKQALSTLRNRFDKALNPIRPRAVNWKQNRIGEGNAEMYKNQIKANALEVEAQQEDENHG
jgi:hypothetical protein